jgi:hypothetical protein
MMQHTGPEQPPARAITEKLPVYSRQLQRVEKVFSPR